MTDVETRLIIDACAGWALAIITSVFLDRWLWDHTPSWRNLFWYLPVFIFGFVVVDRLLR